MTQTWHDVIGPLKETDYFRNALSYYDSRTAEGVRCFPPRHDLFNAFRYTPFDKLKVIMIGQDPYHEINQAMGLVFSVPPTTPIPPSLDNIYKALQVDYPQYIRPNHGCLLEWAQQGVLMLNAILSVEEGRPLSHSRIGWSEFTDDVISAINQYSEHNVFLLWGRNARDKCHMVDRNKNLVLETVHPSPLSAYRGFFNCHHFSMANEYLQKWGKEPINWQITPDIKDLDLSPFQRRH